MLHLSDPHSCNTSLLAVLFGPGRLWQRLKGDRPAMYACRRLCQEARDLADGNMAYVILTTPADGIELLLRPQDARRTRAAAAAAGSASSAGEAALPTPSQFGAFCSRLSHMKLLNIQLPGWEASSRRNFEQHCELIGRYVSACLQAVAPQALSSLSQLVLEDYLPGDADEPVELPAAALQSLGAALPACRTLNLNLGCWLGDNAAPVLPALVGAFSRLASLSVNCSTWARSDVQMSSDVAALAPLAGTLRSLHLAGGLLNLPLLAALSEHLPQLETLSAGRFPLQGSQLGSIPATTRLPAVRRLGLNDWVYRENEEERGQEGSRQGQAQQPPMARSYHYVGHVGHGPEMCIVSTTQLAALRRVFPLCASLRGAALWSDASHSAEQVQAELATFFDGCSCAAAGSASASGSGPGAAGDRSSSGGGASATDAATGSWFRVDLSPHGAGYLGHRYVRLLSPPFTNAVTAVTRLLLCLERGHNEALNDNDGHIEEFLEALPAQLQNVASRFPAVQHLAVSASKDGGALSANEQQWDQRAPSSLADGLVRLVRDMRQLQSVSLLGGLGMWGLPGRTGAADAEQLQALARRLDAQLQAEASSDAAAGTGEQQQTPCGSGGEQQQQQQQQQQQARKIDLYIKINAGTKTLLEQMVQDTPCSHVRLRAAFL